MGVLYLGNYENDEIKFDKFEEVLKSKSRVTIEPLPAIDTEDCGYYNGELFYETYKDGGGGFEYRNVAVEKITVFGLYPGMSEDEAITTLHANGFCFEDERRYYTGEDFGNYFIGISVEDGVVKKFLMHPHCKFAG